MLPVARPLTTCCATSDQAAARSTVNTPGTPAGPTRAHEARHSAQPGRLGRPRARRRTHRCAGRRRHPRSEEHTSELQSLAYLVCRLLLEKKKKKKKKNQSTKKKKKKTKKKEQKNRD